jgi:5-methylthioadenosine/S-adenosylhomocysteine deaminase
MRRIAIAIAAAMVGVLCSHAVHADSAGGILLRGKVVTMNANRTVTTGAVHVKDGKVVAILSASAATPTGATVIDTKGYIYPGLLNLHNHVAYNFLPLYPVPKHYTNRDQWPSGKLYEQLVNNPKNLVTDSAYFDLQTEALKYAEVKAIAGGETAIQGTPSDSGVTSILVRNVEAKNFDKDAVGCRGLSIDKMFTSDLAHQKDSISKLDAWFFHLSEGIDDYARREYSNPAYNPAVNPGPKNQPGLKQLGLVTKPLVGIHCTALTETDFADWEKTTGEGPKIVWSPLSNLLLYGKTTDIPAARRHNATVALGTDWSPSGSKSLLWELKVADQVNKQMFKSTLSDSDLVAMVTCNPAKLLNWQDKVGTIAAGMVADLVVVDDIKESNSYRNLIEATEANIQLVFVGGLPVYGDSATLKKLVGTSGCDTIGERPVSTREKAVVIKYSKIPSGDQSLKTLTDMVDAACNFSPTALAARLNSDEHDRAAVEKWLVSALTKQQKPVDANLKDPSQPITTAQVATFIAMKFPNAKPIDKLDPIFQNSDDTFFTALEANLHFQGSAAVFDAKTIRTYRSSK